MNDSLDFGVRIGLILDDIESGDFDTIPWHLHQLNYHPGSVIPNLSTLFNQHKTEILKEILMVIKDPDLLGVEQEDLEGIVDSLKLLGIRWPEIAIIEKSLNIPSKPLDESDRYHVANIKKYISSWPAIEAVCEIANRLNYGQVELEEIKPVVEQHKTLLITGILNAIREGDTGDAMYAVNILTSLIDVDWPDLKVIQKSLIKDVYN